jgi:hypothetical protein
MQQFYHTCSIALLETTATIAIMQRMQRRAIARPGTRADGLVTHGPSGPQFGDLPWCNSRVHPRRFDHGVLTSSDSLNGQRNRRRAAVPTTARHRAGNSPALQRRLIGSTGLARQAARQ